MLLLVRAQMRALVRMAMPVRRRPPPAAGRHPSGRAEASFSGGQRGCRWGSGKLFGVLRGVLRTEYELHVGVRQKKRGAQAAAHGEARMHAVDHGDVRLLGLGRAGRLHRGAEGTELAQTHRLAREHGADHLLLQLVEHGDAVGLGHGAATADVLRHLLKGDGRGLCDLHVVLLLVGTGLLDGLYDNRNHDVCGCLKG